MFRTLLALLLAAFLAAGPAWARLAKDDEKQALLAKVEEFKAAFGANDMGHIFGMMPPKVLDYVAAADGASIESLQKQMQAAWADALKTVTVESFSMDADAAQYRELEGGTPFALLPTETIMSIDRDGHKQRVAARSQTLGLLDGGQWYLVRIDEPKQLMVIRKIYPEFQNVELPRGTMEALN